jgi:hypothetical protein
MFKLDALGEVSVVKALSMLSASEETLYDACT